MKPLTLYEHTFDALCVVMGMVMVITMIIQHYRHIRKHYKYVYNALKVDVVLSIFFFTSPATVADH